MARSQSELFMQQLLGSCSDRSLSLKCTPRAVPRTTVWPALRNTLGFSRQTGRSSMLPSALAHRRRRKRPALGTFLPGSYQACRSGCCPWSCSRLNGHHCVALAIFRSRAIPSVAKARRRVTASLLTPACHADYEIRADPSPAASLGTTLKLPSVSRTTAAIVEKSP